MTWLYAITSTEMSEDGIVAGKGYSGHGIYKNDPSATDKPDLGPLPIGNYTIGPPFTHPTKGPLVMRLSPEPENVMYGRCGFLIHGDSIKDPGNASNGCIILSHSIRQQMADSDDNDLTVIA